MRVARFCVAGLLLVAACSDDDEPDPALGYGDGAVLVTPPDVLTPKQPFALEITGPAAAIGGVCVLVERWTGSEWKWAWLLSEDVPGGSTPIDDEYSCSAMGVTIPTTFDLTLPDLGDGTWRFAYDWNEPTGEAEGSGRATHRNQVATFVFEIDGDR